MFLHKYTKIVLNEFNVFTSVIFLVLLIYLVFITKYKLDNHTKGMFNALFVIVFYSFI